MKNFLHSRFFSPLIIVLFIVLANSLYLTGIFQQNPINRESGLLVQSSRLVGGLETIDPNEGFSTQALGHAAAESLLHGHLPWWNYNEQVGAPLAGDMQSAALFPLTPLLAFGDGVLYFHIALEIIAGLATYYLLRRLKCGRAASMIGGMLFAVNGTFAWLGNAAFNPIAFLPLLLLGVEVAYNKVLSQQKRGWFLIAIALALSLYAGFPETAYLDTLFGCGWAIVRLLQLRHREWKQFLGKFVFGMGTGLLLATPILTAFFDYYHHGFVGIHAGAVGNTGLPFASLPALVFPYLYGPIFAAMRFDGSGTIAAWWSNVGGYITLSLVFLALVGLAVKGNRYLKVFLAGWVVLMVARVYGFPELYRIIDLLPGMSATAVYRYVQPSFELAVVILAAFGLDHLWKGKKLSKHQIIGIGGVLSAIVTVAVIMALHFQKLISSAPHHWIALIGSIGWGLVSVVIIVICARSSLQYKKFMYSAVIALDALLMFVVPNLSAFHSAQLDTKPVTFLQTHLGSSRFYTLGPIAPNYGTFYNIASIDTNNLPLPANWIQYITQQLNPNTNPVIFSGTYQTNPGGLSNKEALFKYMSGYRYLGVKYIVAPKNLITTSEAQINNLTLVLSSQSTAIFAIANPSPYFEMLKGDCTIKTVNKATVAVDCRQPGLLLRRELFMPGWSASAAGKRLAIKQSGSLFQSVVLPKGSYIVRFNFLPPGVLEAAGLMIIGLLLVVVFYIANIRVFLGTLLARVSALLRHIS